MKNSRLKIYSAIFCLIFIIICAAPIYSADLEIDREQVDNDVRSVNPVHMLVVFTKFKEESPGDTLAPWWADNLFNGRPGSINHYFDETTFGQIEVSGEYLPKKYELPHTEGYYVGEVGKYSWDLIKLLDRDPTVDFSRFDNDGPDRIPSSGDDDGYVDYIVFVPQSRPYGFILKNATGTAHLLLHGTYTTNNADTNGRFIKIDSNSGSVGTALNFHQATGTICHEFIHVFDAFDLYDMRYDTNEEDSGGIGNWGVMGRGLLGWNVGDGPVGPSAYTRLTLGTAGINNENLIDIYGVHREVRLKDSALIDGKIYRVWIGRNEYFLISHRTKANIYADRHLPKDGLLIWHVHDAIESNAEELQKAVDLECADGRYIDAGYPLGKVPDPINGIDNLDFWSHDSQYTNLHKGNLGDATDVYDGVKYTRFGMNTNPNTHSKVDGEPSGIEIFNIRRDGDEMLFDINSPPVTDWHTETYPQIGMALHRFNVPLSFNGAKKEAPTIYIVQHDKGDIGGLATTMVTVGPDEVSVDDITGLDEFSRQREIESKMFPEQGSLSSAKVVRTNVSYDTYADELSAIGATVADTAIDESPLWIQKLTLETGDESLPISLKLNQNFPNPFNSQTQISFVLPETGPFTFEVYNVLGQMVSSLNLGTLPPGNHSTLYDAGDLASGIYFYRLAGTAFSEPRKFILLR